MVFFSPSHLAVVGERYHAFLFQATEPFRHCAVILACPRIAIPDWQSLETTCGFTYVDDCWSDKSVVTELDVEKFPTQALASYLGEIPPFF
jgi:hypothetical protein